MSVRDDGYTGRGGRRSCNDDLGLGTHGGVLEGDSAGMFDELVDEGLQVHPTALPYGSLLDPGFLRLGCVSGSLVPEVGGPDPSDHGLHLGQARETGLHAYPLEGHVGPEDLGGLVWRVACSVDECPVLLDGDDGLPGLAADGERTRTRKPQVPDETCLDVLWSWTENVPPVVL